MWSGRCARRTSRSRFSGTISTGCRFVASRTHVLSLSPVLTLLALLSSLPELQIYRDFIPDPERYRPSDFKKFIEQLHSDHQHYIPIIDAAIPIPVPNGTDTYAPTDSGRELDVFLRHPNGTEYIGQVWPGFTYFPDWHADKSQEWWTAAFKNFSEIVPFDGIWLDMNEPSSFGSYGSSANLSNTPTYVAATSVDGWPEGYDNNTFGNSGNRTVNGTSTHDSQAARKRSALPEIQVAQQIVARQAAEMPSYSYANESQRYLNGQFLRPFPSIVLVKNAS